MIRPPSTRLSTRSLALALVLGTTAAAQTESAGIGRASTPVLDLEFATTGVLHLGVTYLDGRAYVSARGGLSGIITPPHSVFEIDTVSGNVVAAAQQPTVANLSPWGFRDGATDGSSLFFGTEFGIFVCDPSTVQTGVPIGLTSTPYPNPITGPGLAAVGIYRAVAFNPNGDGGNGSIWTGNFGSPIIEIDLQGNVLQTLPNQPAPNEWDVYGLAFDPITGNLWCNSAPFAGPLAEIDLDLGSPTFGMLSGRTIAQTGAGESAGGLAIVPGGFDGRGCGNDLLALEQGTPDTLAGYRLNLWDGYSYRQESELQVGFDGANLGVRDAFVPFGSASLEWNVANPTGQSLAYAAFIDIEPGSLSNRPVGPLVPPALFRSLWELRRGLMTTAMVNGTTNAPMATSVGVPGLPTGAIAIQAIVLDPAAIDVACGADFPIAVTAQRRWQIQPESCDVLVEAIGDNSFNSTTTSGFWIVTNNSGVDIVSLSLSFTGAAQSGRFFDTDQAGIGDTLEGGNSGLAGCLGTYRNGTEVTTGLNFAASPVSPCDPNARTGFVGSDPTGGAGSFQTITLQFTDFNNLERFEFDADTDGGAGSQNGGSQAGTIVTVTLAGGRVCSGVLVEDPNNGAISSVITQ